MQQAAKPLQVQEVRSTSWINFLSAKRAQRSMASLAEEWSQLSEEAKQAYGRTRLVQKREDSGEAVPMLPRGDDYYPLNRQILDDVRKQVMPLSQKLKEYIGDGSVQAQRCPAAAPSQQCDTSVGQGMCCGAMPKGDIALLEHAQGRLHIWSAIARPTCPTKFDDAYEPLALFYMGPGGPLPSAGGGEALTGIAALLLVSEFNPKDQIYYCEASVRPRPGDLIELHPSSEGLRSNLQLSRPWSST